MPQFKTTQTPKILPNPRLGLNRVVVREIKVELIGPRRLEPLVLAQAQFFQGSRLTPNTATDFFLSPV